MQIKIHDENGLITDKDYDEDDGDDGDIRLHKIVGEEVTEIDPIRACK